MRMRIPSIIVIATEYRQMASSSKIFSASAPPPSQGLESEGGDECNDSSTVLEPPTKCPQSHARPIRLGLHLFHPWVVNLSTVLSQYEFLNTTN